MLRAEKGGLKREVAEEELQDPIPKFQFGSILNLPRQETPLQDTTYVCSHRQAVEAPGQNVSVEICSVVLSFLDSVSPCGSRTEAGCLDITWAEQAESLSLPIFMIPHYPSLLLLMTSSYVQEPSSEECKEQWVKEGSEP